MNRALITAILCGLISQSAFADSEVNAPGNLPNILWIIGEDIGPDLACYGESHVETPHLDQMAADGVLFLNAFSTTPVCSTSRSSFMTGMMATTIGAHNHRSHRDDGYQLPQDVRLLTDWLRDAGYFTANVVHFPEKDQLEGTGKTDWNFQYNNSQYGDKPFDSDRWSDLKSHQPFYAQVNFPESHRGVAWDHSHEKIEHPVDPDEVTVPPYYPDHRIARRDWAQYLNTVMALDLKVGRVLHRLKEDGLEDNTIVVFLGDHGRAHLRAKQWCYDSGLHVPLIIRWPKHYPTPASIQGDEPSDRLVSLIDISATTLAMAGISKPPKMEGRVLFGPHAEPSREYVFGTRDRCDETVFRIRTVRDDRYRYIQNFMPERPFLQKNRYKIHAYPMLRLILKLQKEGKLSGPPAALVANRRPAEELYDTWKDPHEIHNLAQERGHAETLARLRHVLAQWIKDSGDQGAIPESDQILQAEENRMIEFYDEGIKKQAEYEQQHGILLETRAPE